MTARHDTALPFVHDLKPAELRDWQAQNAQASGLNAFFQDRLRAGGLGPELAVIPAGRFEMGSPGGQFRFGDLPLRFAQVDAPFAIGRCCITAAEFEAFKTATGSTWQSHLTRTKDRQPVINISVEEAEAYLAWLSDQTGYRYRLPTEAEWEYAARSGSRTDYCFGQRLNCGEANIRSLRLPAAPARGWRRFVPICVPFNKAVDVGSFPPNVWGLFEVHGNVWEFTGTPWIGPLDSENNVNLNRKGHWIVTKGGSWFEGAPDARVAARKPRLRQELDTNLGLRVVRDIP